jgi:5'-deoxynucleotidase YfbR-like HD superfamily hydrolase
MDQTKEIRSFLKFSEEVGNLKDVLRRGWVLKNVPNPESVAVSSDLILC